MGHMMTKIVQDIRSLLICKNMRVACRRCSVLLSVSGAQSEIHYVYSVSLAYEDGILFMSGPFAARQ